MRTLKADGKSIVFITHQLKEVKAIADRITVIRRGRVVGTATPDASEDELASLMVGRTVKLRVDKALARAGEPVLTIAGLVVVDDRGQHAVDGVDLEVRAGEILGVAGVQGNGQSELVEAVMALRPVVAGTVTVAGRDIVGRTTKDVLRSGVAYVPEDRTNDGIVRDFSVAENLMLDVYDRAPYASGLALRPAAIASRAREQIAERDGGAGVLLVSSELDEVLALADRIAVMYRGKVLAVVPPDTPREKIGLLMAGITAEREDRSLRGPQSQASDPAQSQASSTEDDQ